MTTDEMLIEWQSAKENAAKWTERERELRNMIYGEFFADLEDGATHNHALGNGYKLKGKRPLSYKLDDTIETRLIALEAAGGGALADKLVSWKPSLSMTAYALLSDREKAIVDPAITMTPGLPTIELVAPKGDK
ncbi:MAG TPA: hypothetical protein VN081_02135 [Dongiaceae bacterium]|nr:hypothetical protein [Dongiaceae bacterium]